MAAESLSDVGRTPVVIPQRTDLRVVRHARHEERQAKAMRLAWLGWGQKDIASLLGVSQQSVSEDTKKSESVLSGILEMHTQGVPIGEIATRLNLPDILVWTTSPSRFSRYRVAMSNPKNGVTPRGG